MERKMTIITMQARKKGKRRNDRDHSLCLRERDKAAKCFWVNTNSRGGESFLCWQETTGEIPSLEAHDASLFFYVMSMGAHLDCNVLQ